MADKEFLIKILREAYDPGYSTSCGVMHADEYGNPTDCPDRMRNAMARQAIPRYALEIANLLDGKETVEQPPIIETSLVDYVQNNPLKSNRCFIDQNLSTGKVHIKIDSEDEPESYKLSRPLRDCGCPKYEDE